MHIYFGLALVAQLVSSSAYFYPTYTRQAPTEPSADIMIASAPKRYVLGRGCDPVRAAFAAKHMGPKLGVEFETATSDAGLAAMLTNGRKYEAFCIYPGQCQLIKTGHVNGTALEELVRRHHPDIPILHIEDIGQAIPMLQKALSLSDLEHDGKAVAPLTEDWPFVD